MGELTLSRINVSTSQVSIREIRSWRDNGELLLNPPYQRGDVWGPRRRLNLVRSILTGVPIPTIIINDRFAAKWSGTEGSESWSYAVVDGKQRCTTILMLFDDAIELPGHWFGFDKTTVVFSELDPTQQRYIKNQPIGVCTGYFPTIQDEKEVFELVNFGGVPQGEVDNDECEWIIYSLIDPVQKQIARIVARSAHEAVTNHCVRYHMHTGHRHYGARQA